MTDDVSQQGKFVNVNYKKYVSGTKYVQNVQRDIRVCCIMVVI